MIVFDVVVDGIVTETLEPANQRLRDIQGYIHDRVEELKVKYGEFELYRRYIVVGV